MRKKHYTLMTLTLAGVMAFGGAGLLSLKISDAKTEENIVTENQNLDIAKKVEDSVKLEERGEEKQQVRKNINLPRGAKLTEETEKYLKISWEGRQITYFLSESEKEEEADIGMEDVIGITIKSIQKFTGQDLTGNNIEISLHRNVLPDDEYGLLETEEATTNGTFVPVINKKNYGIRYYAVDMDGKKNHSFTLHINSITGEVFGYADYADCYDKDISKYNKEYDNTEIEQIKPEYIKIAKEFMKNNLEELGDVKECYAFTTGMMETEHGTRNTFDIFFKTQKDDIVAITMDQAEKTVLCIEINPLLD